MVADPDLIFIATCAGGVVLFIAENAAIVGKFWRVFKSAKNFAKLMYDIRKMSRKGKLAYIRSKLGSIVGEATGWSDLVTRCTP